jgi:Domain of unknown function (DUF4253)
LQPARIGLAAASRPADLLPLIGWDGAASRWEDAVVIAAVLRSWEERFGARLLRVGFAGIQLLADRPPRTLQAAQRLCACPPGPLVGRGEHRTVQRPGNATCREPLPR